MRVLIVYGTSEGQTRKIAAFIADRYKRHGWDVTLVDIASRPREPDPAAFDAVILAGRVHAGRYPGRLVHFAHRHAAALSGVPSAFVSVSLFAALDTVEAQATVTGYVRRMVAKTGWTPRYVHHAAGARFYGRKSWFGRFVLAFIDRRAGFTGDTRHDVEWTDWAALLRFADIFLASVHPVRTTRAAKEGGAARAALPA